MKAVVLQAVGKSAQAEFLEVPIPKPGLGEVLIQMAASPINPSDLIFLAGANPLKRKLPCIPGFEGSGKVIASGGGTQADSLVGKNVACRAKSIGDGAWAQYMVTEAARCFPLNPDVSFADGATLLVNPLTAWALIDGAISAGHQAAIQTAAASSLGKMILRLAQDRHFPLINVVRREEQMLALRELDCKFVLNSETPDFEKDLRELAAKLSATVCFEAVAGELANQVLKAMPSRSELWSYGGLSGEPCRIEPMVLIYEEKLVRGFWGPPTLYKSPQKLAQAVNEIQSNINSVFHTSVRAKFHPKDFQEALRLYRESMGTGKILFVFD